MERVSHPFGSGLSRADLLVERINRNCFRFGLLGFIGFLEYLPFASGVLGVAELFYLFFLLFLVPPFLGIALYVVGSVTGGLRDSSADERDESSERPASWVDSGYESSPFKVLQSLFMMVHPAIFVQSGLQLLGNLAIVARYRGRLPDAGYDSGVEYRLPFHGEWTVVQGSPDRWYSHSWFPAQQRYAYDFVVTDEDGQTHDGSGGVASFYCFGEPILAPADGRVVTAKDGHRDHHRTTGWVDPLQYRILGNYVVIEHDDDEYSVLAHLKEGSVEVAEDERVEQGERVGRCGNSGNSSEPHLHFHIQDSPNLYLGMGLPVAFSATSTVSPDGEQNPHRRTYVHCGERVSHVDGGTAPSIEASNDVP